MTGWGRSLLRFRMADLLADRLEERIAEDSVTLRSSVERTNSLIEACRIGETVLDRRLANAFHHRREGLPREAVDEIGAARSQSSKAITAQRSSIPTMRLPGMQSTAWLNCNEGAEAMR